MAQVLVCTPADLKIPRLPSAVYRLPCSLLLRVLALSPVSAIELQPSIPCTKFHSRTLRLTTPLPPFQSTPCLSHTTPTPTPTTPHSSSTSAHSLSPEPTTRPPPATTTPTSLHDDILGSKTKTPTVHPIRPRLQPPLPPLVPLYPYPPTCPLLQWTTWPIYRASESCAPRHQWATCIHADSYHPLPTQTRTPTPWLPAQTNAQSPGPGPGGPGSCTPNNATTISLGFTLSTNPPAPRATAFRQGDWMCSAPGCGAHNFGRNSVCIGCGWARLHNHLYLGGSPTAAAAAAAAATATATATAAFGAANLGGMSSTSMNIGPRGGLAVASPSAAMSGGARPGVGNGIPRFAAASASASASAPASTPTADIEWVGECNRQFESPPECCTGVGWTWGLERATRGDPRASTATAGTWRCGSAQSPSRDHPRQWYSE
jgi:hypothetical protein